MAQSLLEPFGVSYEIFQDVDNATAWLRENRSGTAE
jgi:hypothetical protein